MVNITKPIGNYALHVEVAAPVEGAVGDGFHDVVGADDDAGFEVGDGAGHLEDTVVGAGAHVHALHGMLTHPHESRGQKLSLLMTWKSELG